MSNRSNPVIARSPAGATWQSRKNEITLPLARNDRLYWFCCVALTAMYFFFLNPYLDVKGFNQHDPAFYLNRAVSIINGMGYGEQFANRFFTVTIQPPGFSLLLAPIVGLFGVNLVALKLFMVVLAILFAITAFYFFRFFIGNEYFAVASTLLLMSSPVIFGLSHKVMSDIPLFLLSLLSLLFLDMSLQRSGRLFDFYLWIGAIFMVVAYSFKMTALGVLAGGWFLFFHPRFRNRKTFIKLTVFSVFVFIPILAWQHWTTTVPDDWYWTHSTKEFFLKEPFKSDGSSTTLAEFIVRIRRNIVYGMTTNMASVLIAPLLFLEGQLIGFILSLPVALCIVVQWLKSYWKKPSVLEGFFAFNIVLLLFKYHGFAQRYMALFFPIVLVYMARLSQSFSLKVQTFLLRSMLVIAFGVTLIGAVDQWKDPYGSAIMRDYVNAMDQAKRSFSNAFSLAPLCTHWQIMTGHPCYYLTDKATLIKKIPTNIDYIVGLSKLTSENFDTLWSQGKMRQIDRDALKSAQEFSHLIASHPDQFEKFYENDTFALFKVVTHGN